MAQEERYGARDRTYSAWHRRLSTRRFIGLERAQLLALIDIDAAMFCEFDDGTREPIALFEVARDVGQDHKSGTVTSNLAKRAGLPAYLVLYTPSMSANPADPEMQDIEQFRVRRLWPQPETAWRNVTPQQWAQALLAIRTHGAGAVDRALQPAKPRWAQMRLPGTQ